MKIEKSAYATKNVMVLAVEFNWDYPFICYYYRNDFKQMVRKKCGGSLQFTKTRQMTATKQPEKQKVGYQHCKFFAYKRYKPD